MTFGLTRIFSGRTIDTGRGRDVILTGVPRSGTTLACRLLSEYPDVIALNEPLARDLFPDRSTALRNIADSFDRFRTTLRKQGVALARVGEEGRPVDNAYSETSGQRERVIERREIKFDKELSPDFTLIMKHCAEFTLVLPELIERYPTYAIIRNPLASLNSWASVDIPASRGRVAKSGKLQPELHARLESLPDLLDKQLHILDWYFTQFALLPTDRIIRYETVMETGGQALDPIAGTTMKDSAPLSSRNTSSLYDRELALRLGEALLRSQGAYWAFYSHAEVEALMDHMTRAQP